VNENDDKLRELLAETARRIEVKANRPDVLAGAFQQQRDFILDPAKLKALFCTRRSAKSFTVGLYMIREALLNPGCNCLFIGLTRDSAKDIIWKDILRVINQQYKLGATPNLTELTLTIPNGSVIKVTGVDAHEDEMRKLLGKKYRLVCIDEASMYTIDLRSLVYGVLKPAMTDPNAGGERGTICLTGTASNFPRGLFYDVTTGIEGGWKLFQWTAFDNPHVARQWAEELEDIKRERPLYMETPQFKQWYLNQWVVDEEKLVYRFNPQRNLAKSMPILAMDGWSRVLGVDLGWEDDNAFVLTAYHVNDPQQRCFVSKSWAQRRLTFDQVALKIIEFQKDSDWAPHRIVIDGANKQGVESMRERYGIPFEYADKLDKATFIELCNADMVQGKIQFLETPENRPTWEEMLTLVWMTDGDKIRMPKKEHPALSNHRCDGFLYAWRLGYHYHSIEKVKAPPIGSREWYLKQNDQMWEREREALIKQDQGGDDWGDMGGWGD
jgi:phage terminase large subunit